MSYLGVPGAVDRSGLYPSSGYPGAGYPPSQPAMMPGIPQVQPTIPAVTVAPTSHRYPAGSLSQAYAGVPLSHSPSGYYALHSYPMSTSGPTAYTPSTSALSGYTSSSQPSLQGYPSAMPGLSSYPTANPYQGRHPHSAHPVQYAAIQSMHSASTPAGYPTAASQYPSGTQSYLPGPTLGSGLTPPTLGSPLAQQPGNPIRLAGSSPLQPSGSPYSAVPLSTGPRSYPTIGAEINGIPRLGTSPVAQHGLPFGGVQYPGY